MLDEWYNRDETGENNDHDEDGEPNVVDDSDDSQDIPSVRLPHIDHKAQYIALKKKLKFLLYENEFFQDALRSSQRRLLKVTRDRSFLLDRLLQYEKPENSDSESDDTDTSVEDVPPPTKKRKNEANAKKKEPKRRKGKNAKNTENGGDSLLNATNSDMDPMPPSSLHIMDGILTDGHMTTEEFERHMESQQSLLDLPEATDTVPAEMFSHEPSLDGECNDHLMESSSNLMSDDPDNYINHTDE